MHPHRPFPTPQREGTGRSGWVSGRQAKQSGHPPAEARHRTPTAPRSGHRPAAGATAGNPQTSAEAKRRRNGGEPANVGRGRAQRNGGEPRGDKADYVGSKPSRNDRVARLPIPESSRRRP
ncbi:hypothetical protein Sgleb_46820 [Streptomyces glebosus]|uniref:Uncharacterized protein n=1 Tax=Streptomyces glebosus TaxID=249580 RepID=A0A640T4T1_9ACTN|nr:hypothetical protein Sgleb_46820 [Streptomyces glebosus]GHG75745.1 hypothetical protein GCM10010513_50560 [Streptomyces glebosus]